MNNSEYTKKQSISKKYAAQKVILKDFERYPSVIEVYIKLTEHSGGEIIILGTPTDEQNHDCDFIGCPDEDTHIIFRAYLSMIY